MRTSLLVESGMMLLPSANPQTDMHKVINLVKVEPVERKEGEELPEFYRDLGKGIDFQSQAQGNVDIATLVIK
jgi:hypothetical protein